MNEARKVIKKITDTIRMVDGEIRNLGAQQSLTPVRFTVSRCGWLTESSVIGATSVVVSTFPEWAEYDEQYIAIDVGTEECEFRKVTSITVDTNGGAIVLEFTDALIYNHAENDPLLFNTDNTVNVHWFGAKGVNSALIDDTTPIQRAINQTTYNQTQGINVFFPRGLYSIYAQLTIPDGGIALIGESDSRGGSMIMAKDTWAGDMLYADSISYITVRNITFAVEGGENVNDIIHFIDCNYVKITDCYLGFPGRSGTLTNSCIELHTVKHLDIHRCCFSSESESFSPYGIYMTGANESISICENSIFGYLVGGIQMVDGAQYFTISDNIIIRSQDDIAFYGMYLRGIEHGTITGNTIDEHDISCIYLASVGGVNVYNVRISGNALEGQVKVIRSGTIQETENVDRKGEFLDGSRWAKLPAVTHANSDSFFSYAQLLPKAGSDQLTSHWVIPYAYGTQAWWNLWIYLSYDDDSAPPPGYDIYLQIEYWVFATGSAMATAGARVARTGIYGPSVIALPATAYTLKITDTGIAIPADRGNNVHLVMSRLGGDAHDTFDKNVLMWGVRIEEANQ